MVEGVDASIAKAEARYLALPTGMKSFILPNGHRTPTDLAALLIRLTDADGEVGQSLLWAQRPEQLAVFEAALRYLAPAVLAQPAGPVDQFVAGMRQHALFLGHEGATAFGVSGFEMGLQDLTCRRSNVSLSAALGGTRTSIRAYQTGLMLPGTIDELIEEARGIYERGIRAIKMIVGRPTIDEDVERIKAVQSSLPADAVLMVDALQRWTVPQALEATERFADLGLVWIEDPIPHHDTAGLAELVRRSPVKVATGETCFSMAAFEALLDIGVPYVIAELERTGGISGWMRVAQLVHDRGAVMLPHIYPHVSAQVIVALPQAELWWEGVTWFDGLADEPFTFKDGEVVVSQRPGSGFNPSPDAIEKFATSAWLDLVAS